MGQCDETDLTAEAMQHFTGVLGTGLTFARSLLDRADLHRGRIISLLPADTPRVLAASFHRGGVARLADAQSWLVSLIEAFLQRGPAGVVVLENALARPGDPCLVRCGAGIRVFRDEVYRLLYAEDAVPETVRRAIREVESQPTFVGAMTCVSPEAGFRGRGQFVDADELAALAGRAEKVFVGAYDGEGYLVWHGPPSQEAEEPSG